MFGQGEPIPGWEDARVDDSRIVATTTNGEPFSYGESCYLAALIFKRYGRDEESAAAAWRRMLQNGTTTRMFMDLVKDNERINKQRAMDLMNGRFQ